MSEKQTDGGAYWKANVRLITMCLIVWAFCSFGLGILFRDALKGISVGGADLGFWFAQNGSIYVFLFLIFFYAIRMNAIDREHGADEE